MKGYLKNPAASKLCLCRRLVPLRDLAVMDPDGYMKIKRPQQVT
jgi:hypothetical protein